MEAIFSPQVHLLMSGDNFSCHNWREVLLTPSGKSPGMLLNSLHCKGQQPTSLIKNRPERNDRSVEAEKR